MRAGGIALGACLLCSVPAQADVVYIGAWNGMVPVSLEFLDDKTLKFCREDLVLQCQSPVPFTKDGDTIIVENFTNGLKWTYAPRADGGYDATYLRWTGEEGYKPLATATLSKR